MEDLYYDRGIAAIQARNYQDAISHFTDSIRSFRSLGAYNNRAFAYMKLGNPELAKPDFEKAIEMNVKALSEGSPGDTKYADLCIKSIITAMSTVAHIEFEKRNVLASENLNTKLIGWHREMHDPSILHAQNQISSFYSNRGIARFIQGKRDDACRDFAAAYVESFSETEKQEILGFASSNGLLSKVKQCIAVYGYISKK